MKDVKSGQYVLFYIEDMWSVIMGSKVSGERIERWSCIKCDHQTISLFCIKL